MTRHSTPRVATGVYRFTDAPTRFKMSYAANHPLVSPPVAPPPCFLFLFSLLPPQDRYVYTEDCRVYTEDRYVYTDDCHVYTEDRYVYTEVCYVYTEDRYIYTEDRVVAMSTPPTKTTATPRFAILTSNNVLTLQPSPLATTLFDKRRVVSPKATTFLIEGRITSTTCCRTRKGGLMSMTLYRTCRGITNVHNLL